MIFNHKSGYFFGQAAKLWWVFIITGVFALVSPLIIEIDVSTTRSILVGLVAIALSLVLKLNYFGLQIDQTKKQIRDYTAIFGVKTGNWQPIPSFKKITLTSRNVSSWNTPNGISPTFKSNATIYTIALFSNAENPDFFIQTESKKYADQQINHLSELLGIEVERF